MRSLALIVVLVALSGCDLIRPGGDQIADCERDLTSDLKSPSSYTRTDVTVFDSPPMAAAQFALENDTKPRSDDGKVRLRTVLITYDAANAFGASLRDIKECAFKISEPKYKDELNHPQELKLSNASPSKPDCCLRYADIEEKFDDYKK